MLLLLNFCPCRLTRLTLERQSLKELSSVIGSIMGFLCVPFIRRVYFSSVFRPLSGGVGSRVLSRGLVLETLNLLHLWLLPLSIWMRQKRPRQRIIRVSRTHGLEFSVWRLGFVFSLPAD